MDINNADSIFTENVCKDSFIGVKRLCEYKLRSCPDEIDDVMSEVYFAFVSAVYNKKIPDNPKAWLYGVANNIIKDKYSQINKQEKHIDRKSPENLERELAVFPDLSDEMISDEAIEEMADKIISSLTEEERELLTAFHYENKSMKEIGAVMGKSESAVKQKHYRLCIKVRRLIKEAIENY